jgi:hypothetical protein
MQKAIKAVLKRRPPELSTNAGLNSIRDVLKVEEELFDQ